jgi:hypothetical protein
MHPVTDLEKAKKQRLGKARNRAHCNPTLAFLLIYKIYQVLQIYRIYN